MTSAKQLLYVEDTDLCLPTSIDRRRHAMPLGVLLNRWRLYRDLLQRFFVLLTNILGVSLYLWSV